MNEPTLRVGLVHGADRTELVLDGPFDMEIDGRPSGPASAGVPLQCMLIADGRRVLNRESEELARGRKVALRSRVEGEGSFLLCGMTVGVDFHWQRVEDLRFSGALSLEARAGAVDVINEVPLEAYLESVIASEMSARCPAELLAAHAVISRSWLLAQMEGVTVGGGRPTMEEGEGVIEIRRWYDREDHRHFHVCADDHCQRYQGITRLTSEGAASTGAATSAAAATRGLILVHDDQVCDARFSKCCGGMTERFSTAWGDVDLPYLQAFPDAPAGEAPFDLPLTDEARATAYIHGVPDVWCSRADRDLLARLLPELDHETQDFFRWNVDLTSDQIRDYLRRKLDIDPGPIQSLRPLERGPSGRIVRLEITGRDSTLRVGKELEIRRLLSETHLYSSAFTVTRDDDLFHLRGAGWGHGVGLCQIGAAVMAEHGCDHEEILGHYYRATELRRVYE